MGATWSPFKSGATTLRGGAGIFYDWYDAQTYEQTLRVDGVHQVDMAVLNPGYPDPATGGSVSRAAARPHRAGSPTWCSRRSRGRTWRSSRPWASTRGSTSCMDTRHSHTALRGHDVNAPLADGERPDPSSGTVTQVESTARSSRHMLHTGLNLNLPWHRTFLFFNYTLGHAMNESDGPFSLPADNLDLRAEWGPDAVRRADIERAPCST